MRNPPRARTRVGAMMGALGDIEASLAWRFHRVAPAIGTRRESTALFGFSVPTKDRRGGVKVGPALNAAVVTGYASRTSYWWLGSSYQYIYLLRGRQRPARRSRVPERGIRLAPPPMARFGRGFASCRLAAAPSSSPRARVPERPDDLRRLLVTGYNLLAGGRE